MKTTTAVTSSNQYLTFFLAGEEYAISILQVTDIIECGAVTKVPGTPSWIRGVHNLRGAVVPVIDLAVKFGMPATVVTRRTCIVIIELRVDDESMIMGVMADAVNQVVELNDDQIQPAPAFGPKVSVDCIVGMGSSNGKFIVILDIDHVLSSSEILAAVSTDAVEVALLPEAAGVAPELGVRE
jgi:purine-binding chemotaxis protein CheW